MAMALCSWKSLVLPNTALLRSNCLMGGGLASCRLTDITPRGWRSPFRMLCALEPGTKEWGCSSMSGIHGPRNQGVG